MSTGGTTSKIKPSRKVGAFLLQLSYYIVSHFLGTYLALFLKHKKVSEILLYIWTRLSQQSNIRIN